MLTRNLTGSLGNYVRETTGERLRWNRFDLRIVTVLVLVTVLLSAASCAGSSVKASTAKKHFVPRELYIINAKTGVVNQNFPNVDAVGSVGMAAADGCGGWYIGGNFSRIGKVSRYGLARLRSDGSLDSEFAPQLPKRTIVAAIVRHGNVVYASTVPYDRLISIVAAFDARSGRKLWQVPKRGEGGYTGGSLAFANGTLFVGGGFSRIAGVPRSGLAALDPRTGKPTSWHVHPGGASGREGQGQVDAMSIENGVIYYAGGFKGTKTYREENNPGLGAVNVRTGKVTPWNPQPTADLSAAMAILATHGQVLAGGKGFAVYDALTGRVLPGPRAWGAIAIRTPSPSPVIRSTWARFPTTATAS